MKSTYKVFKNKNNEHDFLVHNDEKWGITHAMVFDTGETNYIKAMKKALAEGHISENYYNARVKGN